MAVEKLNTGDWVYMVTVNVQVAIVLNKRKVIVLENFVKLQSNPITIK